MRINGLDVARGVAILGTLATNIWIFTHPAGFIGYLVDPVTADTSAFWATAQRVLMTLSNGKFLGLLTIMFGIGLAIQADSARRKGLAWPGSYPVRAALLMLDGLVNYVLIAEFDVLMGYALTAVLAAAILAGGARLQRWTAITAAALHVALATLVTAAAAVVPASATPAGPNPYQDGSFGDLVVLRLQNWVIFRAEPVLLLPYGVAMFVLGAWLLRAGLFEPRGATLRRRLLILGAAVCPVDLLVGSVGGTAGFVASRYLLAPIVAVGLLAAIAALCLRLGTDGLAARSVAAVGKVSLSCYLLQNLLAGAICYGWGLGLAGRLGAHRVPATVLLFVGLCLSLVVLANLWLSRCSRGPVEALWAGSYLFLSRRAGRRLADKATETPVALSDIANQR